MDHDQMEYEIMTEDQVKMTVQLMLQEHLKGINDKLTLLTERVEELCQGSGDTKTLMEGMLEEIRFARVENQNNYQNMVLKLTKEESMANEVVVDDIRNLVASKTRDQTPWSLSSTVQTKGSHAFGKVLRCNVLNDAINVTDIKTSADDTYGKELVEVSSTGLSVPRSDLSNIEQNGKEKQGMELCVLQTKTELPTSSPKIEFQDISVACESSISLKGPEELRASSAQHNCLEKVTLRFCVYCSRTFEHSHSLKLHIQSCRKKFETALLKKTSSKDVNTAEFNSNNINYNNYCSPKLQHGTLGRPTKMIRCGHCDRSFPTQHQVRSHERVHTGDRPYSCYVCRITFAHGGNMIKHIKSKHPSYNPYVCQHCKANFKTHEDAHQHRKSCTPQRKPVIVIKDEIVFTPPVTGDHADIVDCKARKGGRDSEETATASENENEDKSMNTPPVSSTSVDNSMSEIIPVLMSMSMTETMNSGYSGSHVATTTIADQIYPNKMYVPDEFKVQSLTHQPESDLNPGLPQPFSREEVEKAGMIDIKNVFLPD